MRTIRWWLLMVAALPLSVVAAAADESPVVEPYRNIRDLEGLFPIPQTSATLKVGVFDAATGKFAGLVTHVVHEGPGKIIRIAPRETVDAVNASLTFEVQNRVGSFEVVANGITQTAPAGETAVTINVGKTNLVHWTVRSGTKTYSDTLSIRRPRMIGAGVFTVPALPVTIIYEPPQDRQKQAQAAYTQVSSVGTSIRLSFGQEGSTTTPGGEPSEFSDVTELKSKMETLGTLLSAVPKTKAVGGALKLVAAQLGSVTVTQTEGVSVTNDRWLKLLVSQSETVTTSEHLGPGRGDVMVYLTNARLVWLADSGSVSLALMGYEHPVWEPVESLKSRFPQAAGVPLIPPLRRRPAVPDLPANLLRPRTPHLDRETVQSLLALDPFVAGGPNAPLSGDRFVYIGPGDGGHCFYGALQFELQFGWQLTEGDLGETEKFKTTTEDYRKGFLSFLGLGVTENKSVVTTVTHRNSQENEGTQAATMTLTFFPGSGERYGVRVYYDRAFGTYACVPETCP